MSRRFAAISTSVIALVLSVTGLSAAHAEASASYAYSGTAGGTQIRALGSTIRSDLTSSSAVVGTSYPASTSNKLAALDVAHLLNVEAIATSASATRTGTTISQTSAAKTVHVSVLGGLITADALDTHSVAWRTGTNLGGDTSTKFVRLKIAGQTIPIDLPKNFTISLPGVATVVINESITTQKAGVVSSHGSAIKVTLLDSRAGTPIGSTIVVDPVTSSLAPSMPTNVTKVGGYGYGTRVLAHAGPSIRAESGPTAYGVLPIFGTNGYTVTNSTLAVNLPGLLSAGAIETTNKSTSVPITADVTNTNETARVSLLNGLITADAIKVTAHLAKKADGTSATDASTKLVHLRIAGIVIPIDVPPNTTITIPLIGTVVIDQQIRTATRITVTGLHLTLSVALPGLPVGTDIEVAVASSWVG